MAETQQIPRDRWEKYFDDFTKNFLIADPSRVGAEIQVVSPELGDQFPVDLEHLVGVSYDRKDNSLEFALESGDHRVLNPIEIWTIEEPDGFVSTIEVVGPDDERDIVNVRHVGLERRE
jgi:uncharacterized protein DUF5335